MGISVSTLNLDVFTLLVMSYLMNPPSFLLNPLHQNQLHLKLLSFLLYLQIAFPQTPHLPCLSLLSTPIKIYPPHLHLPHWSNAIERNCARSSIDAIDHKCARASSACARLLCACAQIKNFHTQASLECARSHSAETDFEFSAANTKTQKQLFLFLFVRSKHKLQ